MYRPTIHLVEIPLLLLVFLLISSCSASGTFEQPVASLAEEQKPVRVTGQSAMEVTHGESSQMQRLAAIRAAKLDAARTLVEKTRGIYVKSETTLDQQILTRDSLSAHTGGSVRGLRLVDVRKFGRSGYKVTMEWDGSKGFCDDEEFVDDYCTKLALPDQNRVRKGHAKRSPALYSIDRDRPFGE